VVGYRHVAFRLNRVECALLVLVVANDRGRLRIAGRKPSRRLCDVQRCAAAHSELRSFQHFGSRLRTVFRIAFAGRVQCIEPRENVLRRRADNTGSAQDLSGAAEKSEGFVQAPLAQPIGTLMQHIDCLRTFAWHHPLEHAAGLDAIACGRRIIRCFGFVAGHQAKRARAGARGC